MSPEIFEEIDKLSIEDKVHMNLLIYNARLEGQLMYITKLIENLI